MNKLVRDPAPRFVPTKFDRDPIRTAPGRAVTVWGNARPPAQRATTIPLEPDSGWGVKLAYQIPSISNMMFAEILPSWIRSIHLKINIIAGFSKSNKRKCLVGLEPSVGRQVIIDLSMTRRSFESTLCLHQHNSHFHVPRWDKLPRHAIPW